MAVEVALEDDLLFADLNRQISLLIDEDDNDDYRVARFTSTSPQGYPGSIIHHHPPILPPSQYILYQESCRRSEMCKGTGVFIPQSSQPRRKPKQGKRSSSSKSNKNNKQLLNSRTTTNNVTTHANDNLPPAYATNYINRYSLS